MKREANKQYKHRRFRHIIATLVQFSMKPPIKRPTSAHCV